MWPFKSKRQKLIAAEAELARLEELPESDFAVWSDALLAYVRHGDEEKPKVLARQRSKVAALRVLVGEVDR